MPCRHSFIGCLVHAFYTKPDVTNSRLTVVASTLTGHFIVVEITLLFDVSFVKMLYGCYIIRPENISKMLLLPNYSQFFRKSSFISFIDKLFQIYILVPFLVRFQFCFLDLSASEMLQMVLWFEWQWLKWNLKPEKCKILKRLAGGPIIAGRGTIQQWKT